MRNELDLKMIAQSMDQGILRLNIQGCACKPVAAGEWQRDDQVDQRLAQSDQATSKRHPGPQSNVLCAALEARSADQRTRQC